MGRGALEHKTVAGVSKKAFYKKKQKAFTLAEVLITLAIIGVVAALTIPVVVAKYQQKAYYTAFMKMYNNLSNAVELASADYGNTDTWDYALGKKEFLQKYFEPYLKTTGYTKFFNAPDDTVIKTLNGETLVNVQQIQSAFGLSDFLTLSDGSGIAIYQLRNDQKYVEMLFDTNGAKGPNVWGRDFFYINIGSRRDIYENRTPQNVNLIFNMWDDDNNNRWCNPSSENFNESFDNMFFQGESCSGKLLMEGAMNY